MSADAASKLNPDRNSADVEAAFEAAPPEMVAEILDGELHVAPRPAKRHTRASSRLGRRLGPFDDDAGPGGWVILDEPELHLGPKPDKLVPDLAGWRRERMPDALGPEDGPAHYDLVPDWACEVLSEPTNLLSFGPDAEAVELRALNGLIGPNGSGKSNSLEAIGLLHKDERRETGDGIVLSPDGRREFLARCRWMGRRSHLQGNPTGGLFMAAKKRRRARHAAPKRTATIRVAVHAPGLHQPAEMGVLGNKIVAAAAGNPGGFGASIYIPQLVAALSVLTTATTDAQGGPDAALVALSNATKKVHDIIVLHAAWVQGNAHTLPAADAQTYIVTSGFQVVKAPTRNAVSAPTLTHGFPGLLHFVCPSLAGFIMWFTEVSSDDGKTFVRTTDTEHVKGDIAGLTSGASVIVRFRAFLRGTGYTPWFEVPIIVT